MKTKSEKVLMLMQVFAVIAMTGYAIEAGAKIISTIVSFYNPKAAFDIYKGLDLSQLRLESVTYYLYAMSLLIAIPMLKSHIWLKVINLLRNFSLDDPFKIEVTNKFDSIVQDLVGIVVVSFIAKMWFGWLQKKTDINFYFDSRIEEYIFMTTLIFMITHIFKKGVELQNENDLTV